MLVLVTSGAQILFFNEMQNGHKKFPYDIRKVKGVIHNKIVSEFKGQLDGVVQVGPEKWILPSCYADFAETINNFEARPDDVFISTFLRSGTTWTQEMIWLICNDMDYEIALSIPLLKRFPFLEIHLIFNSFLKSFSNAKSVTPNDCNMMHRGRYLGPVYEILAAQTGSRFIKTHLPIQLMPRNIKEVGAKVVYVARNPKDVTVSNYHFHKVNPAFQSSGDFETFLKYFMDDLIIAGPYWKHILDGWNHRNDENVHFMFYENLKFDMENSLRKLSTFLGKPLKDEDLPKLIKHLQFENMERNETINFKFNDSHSSNSSLVRRGKVGGNPEITKEISKKIDDWSKKNLQKSDLKFPCFVGCLDS